MTPSATTTGAGVVKLAEQSATKKSEAVSAAAVQTREASSKKAEIIGEDEVAIEQELPYDTSTATGKLAAAVITGKTHE